MDIVVSALLLPTGLLCLVDFEWRGNFVKLTLRADKAYSIYAITEVKNVVCGYRFSVCGYRFPSHSEGTELATQNSSKRWTRFLRQGPKVDRLTI